MATIGKPEKLYIEKDALGYKLTGKIVSRLVSVPSETIDNYKSIVPEKIFSTRAEEDKNFLTLAVKNGELVKILAEWRVASFIYSTKLTVDTTVNTATCSTSSRFRPLSFS